MNNPKRGEIWLLELDPTRGQEIKKTHSTVVISSNLFSSIPSIFGVAELRDEY